MDESGLLPAVEAAARLGVKKQTLYAYVSRGVLHRQVALDGRTSLFDPAELDALRLGKRDRSDGELRAVIATAITRVSDDALLVRGHDLIRLVADGHGFGAICDLLWLAPTSETWPKSEPGLTTSLSGIDGLRSILASASAADPLRHDLSPPSVRAAGRRMITAMVHGLPEQAKGSDRTLEGALWRRLTATRGGPKERATLDAALALLLDHGLAASTFAARIAASVRADPYSVATSGLGAIGGRLHGAASTRVHDLLSEADRLDDAAQAVGACLRSSESLPGFGHSVYTRQDPRYALLMTMVVDVWADDPRLQRLYQVRDVVGSRRGDFPNIDLALGAFTWLASMPQQAGETSAAVHGRLVWL